MILLEIVDNCYEFSIYDTGIEFVTTHKEFWGSGIEFMTTFETLKGTKAEEYNPEKSCFTKSITVRFDKKNEYKIKSYRAKETTKKNQDNRIIVEML